MTVASTRTTIAWGNYLAPTPIHLQMWVESLHGALVVIVTSSFIQGSNPKTLLYLMLAGYGLDKLSKFFGQVAADMQHVTIDVQGTNLTTSVGDLQSGPSDTLAEKIAVSAGHP